MNLFRNWFIKMSTQDWFKSLDEWRDSNSNENNRYLHSPYETRLGKWATQKYNYEEDT